MTSSLPGFLLARIAEEHEAAVAATVGPWRWDGNGDLVTVLELPLPGSSEDFPGSVLWSGGYDSIDPPSRAARSTASTSRAGTPPGSWPAAGCRARQRIVRLLEPLTTECAHCGGCPTCETLRLLAHPYATHPEWHPTSGAGADR